MGDRRIAMKNRMETAKDFVRKVEKLKKRISFALYCLPKGDDEWFTEQVKKLGTEKNVVSLSAGRAEDKECLYHIYIPASYSGFFSNFNRVLAYLYFADCYHLIPVIEYSSENPYAEKEAVNDSKNPFEYYFEQPAGIVPENLGNYSVVLHSRRENSWLANELDEVRANYTRSNRFIAEMGRMIRTYIRLKEDVATALTEARRTLLGRKRTLGVHVRGTDFKWNYNGHPVCITVEEYLQQATELVREKKYEQVFLATDDLDAIGKFRQIFGEKLVYYEDVIRSNGTVTVMKSESERERHHYLLGLEVLRDVLTLSDCEGLLAGLSQVSYAARFFKASYEKEYEDLKILNKGINEHTRNNCPK